MKFIFKEDLTPPHVYKPLYIAAPMIAVVFALTSIAVIPFGNCDRRSESDHTPCRSPTSTSDCSSFSESLLSASTAVALSGWSSNSKYSLLGGLRASAQMISYEIALGLSLVGVLILSGSFSLRDIVEAQAGHSGDSFPSWNIFPAGQFVAFFIYLMAAYAETNRIPFDLPEAETELVAGYHTEYSAMKFAMFFMAEYANMITVAAWRRFCFSGDGMGRCSGRYILQVHSAGGLVCLRKFLYFCLCTSGCAARCRVSL